MPPGRIFKGPEPGGWGVLLSAVVRAKGRGLPEPLAARPVLPDLGHAELLRALRFPPLTQEKLMAAEKAWPESPTPGRAPGTDPRLPRRQYLGPEPKLITPDCLQRGHLQPCPQPRCPQQGAGRCRGDPCPSVSGGDTAVPLPPGAAAGLALLTAGPLTVAGSRSLLI